MTSLLKAYTIYIPEKLSPQLCVESSQHEIDSNRDTTKVHSMNHRIDWSRRKKQKLASRHPFPVYSTSFDYVIASKGGRKGAYSENWEISFRVSFSWQNFFPFYVIFVKIKDEDPINREDSKLKEYTLVHWLWWIILRRAEMEGIRNQEMRFPCYLK